jgi:hypothetical protein
MSVDIRMVQYEKNLMQATLMNLNNLFVRPTYPYIIVRMATADSNSLNVRKE